MLVHSLKFWNYSCQNCDLFFVKLCQHIRRKSIIKFAIFTVTSAHTIDHHFVTIWKSSKPSTFNNMIMLGKISEIHSTDDVSGMCDNKLWKNCDIIVHRSLNFLEFFKILGLNEHYWGSKFERNHNREGYFMQLKYICNFVRRRKLWRKLSNFQEQLAQELLKWLPSILICEVVHM